MGREEDEAEREAYLTADRTFGNQTVHMSVSYGVICRSDCLLRALASCSAFACWPYTSRSVDDALKVGKAFLSIRKSLRNRFSCDTV